MVQKIPYLVPQTPFLSSGDATPLLNLEGVFGKGKIHIICVIAGRVKSISLTL